jgi:pimeloyl-ACP methyl ester carboxylesterase
VTLFHQRYGEGFPLVILHGLFGASGNWHTLCRNVFSRRFAVYAVDLRNHGRSPHDDAMSYPLMAGDLLEFLDAQGLPRAHVLGHSLGGKVAMTFALTHPERMGRLVVADIAPRAYGPNHTAIFNALGRLDLATLRSRTEAEAALAPDIPSAPVRQFLLKNLESDPAGGFSWKMNLDALVRHYDTLNAALPVDGIFTGDVLFIRGGTSSYVATTDEPEIRRLFPAADIHTLPGVGHWVHAEAPEAFAAAVMDFLTR